MPDNPSIRQLLEADWEIFASMRLHALQECPSVFSSNYAKEKNYTADDWAGWLKPEGKCVFGLFDKETLIGITGAVTVKQEPTNGVLYGSFIQRPYRGRGLSDLFYESRIGWAKDYLPWKKLIVSHRENNEASRRANQRHGFVYTHRASKIWPDGVTCDELCYELDLEKLRMK